MSLYDNLLVLDAAVAGTASRTGGYVDLMKGTTVAANSTTGVDLYGQGRKQGFDIYVNFQATGAASTPSTTFSWEEADDTSGTNLVSHPAAAATTADGTTKILFNPTKRFVRAKSVWTTGTLPYTAAVGL